MTTDTFLKKTATDAGFDIPASHTAHPGWLQCASCRFTLIMWLRQSGSQTIIALSKRDVLEKLLQETGMQETGQESVQLPPAAGAITAATEPACFALITRATQLEMSLPHRILEAYERDTKDMRQTTEAEQRIVRRIGQSKLRAGLLEYWDGKCAVTGLSLPPLLRASHIKPWRACGSAKERLNVYNALLLAPHLDALFDGGWIGFADDGHILPSPLLTATEKELLAITPQMKITRVDSAHHPYLHYHRTHILNQRTQTGRNPQHPTTDRHP